jgi:hypothetical protein
MLNNGWKRGLEKDEKNALWDRDCCCLFLGSAVTLILGKVSNGTWSALVSPCTVVSPYTNPKITVLKHSLQAVLNAFKYEK